MLTEFVAILAQTSTAAGVNVEPWTGASRKSTNLLQISTTHRRIVLHIKESNLVPGWWGLNPGQLHRLRDSGDPWFVAFLSGSNTTAYLATPRDVNMRAGAVWRPAKDGDFKIHENAELLGIAALAYSDLSDYLIGLIAEDGTREDGKAEAGGSDRQRRDGYSTLLAGDIEASHIAEFLVRLPGKKRQVAHASTSNLRIMDLLAGFLAIVIAPGDSPEALASKVIPFVARMIQTLSDNEAIVIRAMCELTAGHSRSSEAELLRHINGSLTSERDRQLTPEQLKAVLATLAKKKCVEPIGLNSGWKLRPIVL